MCKKKDICLQWIVFCGEIEGGFLQKIYIRCKTWTGK